MAMRPRRHHGVAAIACWRSAFFSTRSTSFHSAPRSPNRFGGGLLMAKAPGGDWKSVDWNALAAFIAGHADEISACGTQPLDTDGASKRLREWEKAKRQQV